MLLYDKRKTVAIAVEPDAKQILTVRRAQEAAHLMGPRGLALAPQPARARLVHAAPHGQGLAQAGQRRVRQAEHVVSLVDHNRRPQPVRSAVRKKSV